MKLVCYPVTLCFAFLAHTAVAATVAASWEHPPAGQREGVFWREHWYERGITNHNPAYERRLRVNSPEAVLDPNFGRRVEARENGLMLIQSEEDLFNITGAELYLEMWGGHPGTAGKRVTVNGRTTHWLPRLGAEEGHCTYSYPVISLQRTDLVNGWNAFQLAVDQGTTFWGHMMVDEACLRVALTNGHPDLVKLKLAGFEARVLAEAQPDSTQLSIESFGEVASRIARVDFQAWHSGYDENGDQRQSDWHGFTHKRQPGAFAAMAAAAPFETTWDTSMLPAQKNVAVRALIRFKDAPELVFVTAALAALTIPDRAGVRVALYTAHDLPPSFWSRAGNKKTCHIALDVEPSRIQRAQLNVVTWTGGAGNVKKYFTLNGKHFPVADGSSHLPHFSRLPVEPSLLRRGENTIELLSDTEHHGIEVILPGPALMVRYEVGQ